MKFAAARKVNLLLDNALSIMNRAGGDSEDTILVSNFAKGIFAYSKFGITGHETLGGFKWGWKSIYSGSIEKTEGVWYSARLVAANICQMVVCIYIVWGGITMTSYIAQEYDPEQVKEQASYLVENVFDENVDETALVNELTFSYADYLGNSSNFDNLDCRNVTGRTFYDSFCPNDLCDPAADANYQCGFVGNELSADEAAAVLEALGFDFEGFKNTTQAYLQAAATQAVNSLYPSSKYMVVAPMILAVLVAFLVSANLAVTFIPSITSTTLKLRGGIIPFKHSPEIQQYRVAQDTVALLTGSLFWGVLVSSIVVGGFFGLILFFFLWQATAYWAQRLVAIMLGVMVITVTKVLILLFFRTKYYEAFYRIKPGAANLVVLVLEWASFALSSGFIFVRMVKILLVGGFCIGRIDRPFLAAGLGYIGPIQLDAFPTIFLRDILAHEGKRETAFRLAYCVPFYMHSQLTDIVLSRIF